MPGASPASTAAPVAQCVRLLPANLRHLALCAICRQPTDGAPTCESCAPAALFVLVNEERVPLEILAD